MDSCGSDKCIKLFPRSPGGLRCCASALNPATGVAVIDKWAQKRGQNSLQNSGPCHGQVLVSHAWFLRARLPVSSTSTPKKPGCIRYTTGFKPNKSCDRIWTIVFSLRWPRHSVNDGKTFVGSASRGDFAGDLTPRSTSSK